MAPIFRPSVRARALVGARRRSPSRSLALAACGRPRAAPTPRRPCAVADVDRRSRPRRSRSSPTTRSRCRRRRSPTSRRRPASRSRSCKNGDAGKMVNTAILTKNRPQGDVLFGVDNTFLSQGARRGHLRAVRRRPGSRTSTGEVRARPASTASRRSTTATSASTTTRRGSPTRSSRRRRRSRTSRSPQYKDLLVVENPATSSPGLSFLLATVAKFGEDGWTDYWTAAQGQRRRRSQPGWDEAYYTDFTAGGDKGKRRSSSRTRAARPRRSTTPRRSSPRRPTAVVESTCFASIEFAGRARRREARRRGARARRLPDRRRRSRRTSRRTCTSTRCAPARRCRSRSRSTRKPVADAADARRRRRSARTARHGRGRGSRPCWAEPRGRSAGRPAGWPARARWSFLGLAVRAARRRRRRRPGCARAGSWDLARHAGRARVDDGVLSTAWFTVWQAAAVVGADARSSRCPARTCSRASSSPAGGCCTRRCSCRSCCRPSSSAPRSSTLIGPTGVLGVDLSGTVWAILVAHVFFNYAVVVRTVGGLLGAPRPAARGGGARARRLAVARVPRGDLAAGPPGRRVVGARRLPVHVHLVRRRPGARRRAGSRRSRRRSTPRPPTT